MMEYRYYDEWNEAEKELQTNGKIYQFREREIWWYAAGENTGSEIYYTEANDIKMNQNSSYFFHNMCALSDLSTISSWDTSSVTDMSCMFNNAGENATTWSVTIPKTNKGSTPITNTTTILYGNTTSIYAAPLSGKTFTLAN